MLSHKHSFRFHPALFCLGLIAAPSLISAIMSTNTFAATYEASISTSGSITLDVSPAGNGASVTTDTLNIISTCPEGYNVYIQGPADTTLYKDGNKSNTEATKKINASAGTKDTPRGIIGTDTTSGTSNMNTWGYSIGDPATGNTFTPATIHSTSFVGLNNNLTSLYTKNSGTTATGDNLPVYYGVSVDTSIETGPYTMAETTTGAGDNKITYFLTTSINCTTYQVAFDPSAYVVDDYGNTIEVTGTGTMNNQRITEGIATPLTANAFTAPTVSGTTYYFAGWNTAKDGSGTSYTNGQSVTDITTPGNTITLYAQWTDCPGNKICYKPNGATAEGTTAAPSMGNQSISTSATSIGLWASNFKNPIKGANNKMAGFAGWNTKYDGTGTSYGPNETITFTAGQYSNGGLKLYAMWVESAGDLQGWTCPDDTTMPVGTVTALTDQRDGNTYAVAKLADGKCWMIENLRLDNTNSDNSTGALAQGYGTSTTYGNFSGLAEPETANFSSSTTANSIYYSGTQSGTASINIGTSNTPGYRMPRFNNQNTASPATNMTGTGNNTYSYGNWYTWSAAVADTSYYSTNNQSITETSICPKGWHLPKGGNNQNTANNEFLALSEAIIGAKPADYSSQTYPYYGRNNTTEGTNASNKLRSFPNNFIYSGYFNDSSARSRGSNGFYWSSSVYGSYYSYNLNFSSSRVNPGTYSSSKYYGFSVRCLVGS